MIDEEIIKIDSTVKDSLEYYDKNCEKYENFIKKIKFIKLVNNKNLTDEIIFLDENKKVLLESSYEILGIYLPKQHIWKWSWSIPTWHKKFTFISRKILEWAFNLDQDKEYLLRSKLINSKIKIINNLQLDMHIAISSYIGKQPLIFKFYNRIDDSENSDDSSENTTNSSTNNNDLVNYVSDNKDFDENYMIMYFFILNYEDIKN
jgi:hypothetical protein